MTRLEQRLKKAKTLFPKGTKFISLFGAYDVVESKSKIKKSCFWDKKPETHFANKDNTVTVLGKSGQFRVIFDNGKWAKKY